MIANLQEQSCKALANGIFASVFPVDGDRQFIERLVEWTGLTATQVAKKAGLTPSTLTRPLNHDVSHRLSLRTIEALRKTFPEFPEFGAALGEPESPPEQDYVPVEVLPTYAGMGGGGTGEGEREIALVPRALVVDILRGQPQDFLLINVRGDSMEPDFRHGDQLLVDRRDTSPAQPGPFALWDGEWGEYVVKNVERSRTGEVRIFSTNPKYSNESAPSETTRIIGRPVWFGRRL